MDNSSESRYIVQPCIWHADGTIEIVERPPSEPITVIDNRKVVKGDRLELPIIHPGDTIPEGTTMFYAMGIPMLEDGIYCIEDIDGEDKPMNSADSISRSCLLALLNSKEYTQKEIIAIVKELPPNEVDNNYTQLGEPLYPFGLG